MDADDDDELQNNHEAVNEDEQEYEFADYEPDYIVSEELQKWKACQ